MRASNPVIMYTKTRGAAVVEPAPLSKGVVVSRERQHKLVINSPVLTLFDFVLAGAATCESVQPNSVVAFFRLYLLAAPLTPHTPSFVVL